MKIIITDLDGTLLNDNGEVSEYTKNTIRRVSRNNILVAASGRGMSGIKNCLNDIIDCFNYFICGNGSCVCDENGNIIYEKLLSEDKTNFICGLAKRLETDFRVMKYDKYETLRGEEETFNEARKNGFEVIRTDKFSSGYKAVISGNTDKIEETILKLQKEKLDGIDYVRSDLHNIDFGVKGVSKAKALKYICNSNKIDCKDTIAFGDAGNDIDLLCFVKVGVAMKNSLPELKEYATRITEFSNNEDGVARFLASLKEICF